MGRKARWHRTSVATEYTCARSIPQALSETGFSRGEGSLEKISISCGQGRRIHLSHERLCTGRRLEPENRANSQARRALRLSKHPIRMALEPTAIIIFCTADPVKVDGRTRSRWSRLLRYAAAHNTPPKALATFIKCRGGINRCSSLLSTPENAV